MRLTQGSPPALSLVLPETAENRTEEETPKRGRLEPQRLQAAWQQVRKNAGAAGIDQMTVEKFAQREERLLVRIHDKLESGSYRFQSAKRVLIEKEGTSEARKLGIPGVMDRIVGTSMHNVLEEIFDLDFTESNFGFRRGKSQHQAIRHLQRLVKEDREWAVAVDLNSFFDEIPHGLILKLIRRKVADEQFVTLLARLLKAGVMVNGAFEKTTKGCPQGSPISVLLSNVYLHYVLDLWFERVVKPRLAGEAYLVRYIDDFVLCFQYRADALRVQNALRKRLGKFGLELEPTKTKLVEFGRFAQRHASKRGRKRPETIYFLGFTLYCTQNQKGNFKVGLRTEKSRLQRTLSRLRDLMRRMRHLPVREQVINLNRVLRGHFAYYGIAGNLRALQKVHRFVERYWRKMLCSRSRKGNVPWENFQRIKERFSLQRPRLVIPYRKLQSLAVL